MTRPCKTQGIPKIERLEDRWLLSSSPALSGTAEFAAPLVAIRIGPAEVAALTWSGGESGAAAVTAGANPPSITGEISREAISAQTQISVFALRPGPSPIDPPASSIPIVAPGGSSAEAEDSRVAFGVVSGMGSASQSFFMVSALGNADFPTSGTLAQVNGEVRTASATVMTSGGPSIDELPPFPILAPFGAVLELPQMIAVPAGSNGLSTIRLSSLGPGAIVANSAAVVGPGITILAPSGTSGANGAGSMMSLPAMDRLQAPAGRGLAQPLPIRNATDQEDHASVATLAAGTPRNAEQSGPSGIAVPAPERYQLIMDFMPFDHAVVGQSIDQFLEQLEDLGAGLSWLQRRADVAVKVLALALDSVAWKLVPKLLERSRTADELAAVDLATSLDEFAGLPGGSSPEES